jgi:hypothetical protein
LTLESGQGSGLGKFARLHGFTQKFCLRHFLATIQDQFFFVFVHHLVKALTDSEFLLLSAQYPREVQKGINNLPGTGWKRARGQFRKAWLDLIYTHAAMSEIGTTDTVRWQRVSSMFKVREGLPMTTNALESINDHRNEAKARNNTFWMSTIRPSRAFGHSIESFSSSLRHNFNTTTRRALGQRRAMREMETAKQRTYYKMKAENGSCDCGYHEYFPRMFNMHVPCCHFLSTGLPHPALA